MPLPGAVCLRRRGCHCVETGSFYQAVQLSCARGLHRGESNISWSPGLPLVLRQLWGAWQPALMEAGRRGWWLASCRGTCTGHCHRAHSGRTPRSGFPFLALEIGYKKHPFALQTPLSFPSLLLQAGLLPDSRGLGRSWLIISRLLSPLTSLCRATLMGLCLEGKCLRPAAVLTSLLLP